MTQRSLDAVLQLLADGHRREVIHHLRHEANGRTTIDDLVDRLPNGGSVTEDHPAGREGLAIQLYHAHLPKLADYGVVEFDPEDGVVRYRADERIETVLDSLADELSLPHRNCP